MHMLSTEHARFRFPPLSASDQNSLRLTDLQEIQALKDQIHQRVSLVDTTLQKKKNIGGLKVDPIKWEDRRDSETSLCLSFFA